MRVQASPEAVRLVQDQGGKLYIWARRSRCCHGSLTFLETSYEPGESPCRRVETNGIDLYLDDRLGEPDELVVEAKGRRRRHVHAYWNGCAYVVQLQSLGPSGAQRISARATGAHRHVSFFSSADPRGYADYLRTFSISRGFLSAPLQVSPEFGDTAVWPGDTFGLSTLSPNQVVLSWGSATSSSKDKADIFTANVAVQLH